jgi:hypothetical protein
VVDQGSGALPDMADEQIRTGRTNRTGFLKLSVCLRRRVGTSNLLMSDDSRMADLRRS